MEGGAWWAAVHGVAMSRTWLSDFTFTFHFHALEKEMATHSSVLAWRIPGMGDPGGLLSMGLHRVGHDWSDLAAAAAAAGKESASMKTVLFPHLSMLVTRGWACATLAMDYKVFKRWKAKSKNEWPNFSVYEWLKGRCYSPINDWWGCSFTNLLRTREGWMLELVKMAGVGIKTHSWGTKQMLSLDNRWTVTDTIYYLHTSQCTLEKIKLLADPERFWISIGLTKKFIWGFSITS